MNKDKLIVVGRWAAVLPCAVIASLLTHIVLFWANNMALRLMSIGDGLMGRCLRLIVPALFVGIVFVGVGVAVAPKKRKQVGIVLAVLVALICGFSIAVSLMSRDAVGDSILSGIATIVGAVYFSFNNEKSMSETVD